MKKTLCSFLVLICLLLCAGCGSHNSQPEPSSTADHPAFGTVKEKVYTNSYAGFGCKLDEEWMFAQAKDNKNPQPPQEPPSGNTLADLPIILDLQVLTSESGSSFSVGYTDLQPESRAYLRTMTQEQLVDELLKQKDAMEAQFTEAGMRVKSIEKTQMQFLGETHTVCRTAGSIRGLTCIMVQIMDFGQRDFGINVNIMAHSQKEAEEILNCFYKV